MSSILDQVTFLIGMYKKAKNHKAFLSSIQSLVNDGLISDKAVAIVTSAIQADAPVKPTKVAPVKQRPPALAPIPAGGCGGYNRSMGSCG